MSFSLKTFTNLSVANLIAIGFTLRRAGIIIRASKGSLAPLTGWVG